MLWGTEDKVIRDPEAKRQASKRLWETKEGITGAQQRRRDVGHFLVKVKKEQLEMMFNSCEDTQMKFNILWYLTHSPTN